MKLRLNGTECKVYFATYRMYDMRTVKGWMYSQPEL